MVSRFTSGGYLEIYHSVKVYLKVYPGVKVY
jgi:hypothetical protein